MSDYEEINPNEINYYLEKYGITDRVTTVDINGVSYLDYSVISLDNKSIDFHCTLKIIPIEKRATYFYIDVHKISFIPEKKVIISNWITKINMLVYYFKKMGMIYKS